ncbi:hypothetical protein O3V59_21200 [Brevibacillus thermoruber]|uniref:Uncharacterized protein n=1 Tax=Brevibacillus thermoruber TaxID=33942 RepID=A0A9X3TV88_9BACL|nr:hypothetical protein [Brevibacillus thermoruber]MDA5110860.1 hypothetical protein [Brevibacillus thermoruber]
MDAFSDHTSPPKELYYTATDWVYAFFHPAMIHQFYREFPMEEIDITTMKQPLNWPTLGKPRPHYIAVVPNGRVWGGNGAVISPDNKLIWDSSHDLFRHPHEHSIFSIQKLPPVTYTSETLAPLTYAGSDKYYFWMFDVLGRFELLRRNNVKVDKYVFTPMRRPFQEETLSVLGIPKEKQIICEQDTHIEARKLFVTPLVADTGIVPKWVCDFLRDEFFVKRGIKPSRKY